MDLNTFDFSWLEQEQCRHHGLSIIGGMVQSRKFRIMIQDRFRFRIGLGFETGLSGCSASIVAI